MAVTNVTKLPTRLSNMLITNPDQARERYHVTVDDPNTLDREVLTATTTGGTPVTIPVYGDTHASNSALHVSGLTAQQVSMLLWEVTVAYAADAPLQPPSSTLPAIEFASINWRVSSIMLPLPEDAEGEPYVNTAGVPIEPIPLTAVPMQVATLAWNSSGWYYDDVAAELAFTVNKYPFDLPGRVAPVPARAAYMADITIGSAVDPRGGGIPYWRVSIVLHILYGNPYGNDGANPWDIVIPSMGFVEKRFDNEGVTRVYPIMLPVKEEYSDGTSNDAREWAFASNGFKERKRMLRTQRPMPLNDAGHFEGQTATAAKMLFTPHRTSDFRDLRFPSE